MHRLPACATSSPAFLAPSLATSFAASTFGLAHPPVGGPTGPDKQGNICLYKMQLFWGYGRSNAAGARQLLGIESAVQLMPGILFALNVTG
jgi:hypothetical protein